MLVLLLYKFVVFNSGKQQHHVEKKYILFKL